MIGQRVWDRRARRWPERLAVLASLGMAWIGPAAGTASADSSWHTFTNAAGTRSYLLGVPDHPQAHPPLLVFLHGCNQTAAGVAHDAGWAKLADAKGFVAVFPQEPVQPTDTVLKGCWNWTTSTDQHRGTGEPSIIAGITEQVASDEHVDRRRIYIAGYSAGAYMADILAVTYPDIYAAAGIVAGGPYGLGTGSVVDPTGQSIVDEMGPRKRAVPIVVVQATNDNINPFPAGFAAVQQWLNAYDLIDDGRLDDSVSHIPAAVDTHRSVSEASAGSPTPCDLLAPCPGGLIGLREYPYTVAHYDDPYARPLLAFWTIYGANHDYTGGSGTFMDPTGPSMTTATWGFLSSHRL